MKLLFEKLCSILLGLFNYLICTCSLKLFCFRNLGLDDTRAVGGDSSIKEACYKYGYLVDRQKYLCGLNENIITVKLISISSF